MTRQLRRSLAVAVCGLLFLSLSGRAQFLIDPRLYPLIRSARQDINTFWASRVPNYIPPADVVMIQAPTMTDCGRFDQPNAMFCTSTNKIYWDVTMFASQFRLGDFAPVFILAHEWGHLVQHGLGFDKTEVGLIGIQLELQADCLAGTYAASARDRKLLDPGDDDEAMLSLRRAGDPLDGSWFDPRAHGTAGLRIDAFTYGLEGNNCTTKPFFDFLKQRGVDPAKAPQTQAPAQGGLDALVPRKVGRFSLTDAKHMDIVDANDAVKITYRTADGINVSALIVAFASPELAMKCVNDNVAEMIAKKGYREVGRQRLVSAGDKPLVLGVSVSLQGVDEMIFWANQQTVGALQGPVNVTYELFRGFPF